MATYYVDPVSGSNGNAGTSFALAWATTQHALDNLSAGDEVRLCNTGTETTAVQIDVDTTSGTLGSKIHLLSYNATGTAQEDGYTIQASASINAIISVALALDHYHWRGITFDADANATYCIDNSANSPDYWSWKNCRFTDATSHGMRYGGTVEWIASGCEFDSNGGDGFSARATNTGAFRATSCTFRGNGSDGAYVNRIGECVLDGCLIYGNTAHGVNQGTAGDFCNILNCTIVGNGSNGINADQGGTRLLAVTNTTICNSGAYGIGGDTGTEPNVLLEKVHFDSNTSGDTQFTPFDADTLTGSPVFEDAASDDYRLGSGSPLIAAGVGGRNIGALPQVCSGGGGSGGAWVH